ncbi:unnamed protein product [Moneuplotes crassus]|uniref:Uncharacterized protein n=3 Tax=Euplotes crassus TaxID=5936 RepID=A0AAD1Y8X7_EUPCR|nr:unnamed protein product [Moneuplotes crassus]
MAFVYEQERKICNPKLHNRSYEAVGPGYVDPDQFLGFNGTQINEQLRRIKGGNAAAGTAQFKSKVGRQDFTSQGVMENGKVGPGSYESNPLAKPVVPLKNSEHYYLLEDEKLKKRCQPFGKGARRAEVFRIDSGPAPGSYESDTPGVKGVKINKNSEFYRKIVKTEIGPGSYDPEQSHTGKRNDLSILKWKTYENRNNSILKDIEVLESKVEKETRDDDDLQSQFSHKTKESKATLNSQPLNKSDAAKTESYYTHGAGWKKMIPRDNAKLGPGAYDLNKSIKRKYQGITFPKARRTRDNSVDRILHKRTPMKRPTICANFDDSYESSDDERTTEVTRVDNSIYIYDKKNPKFNDLDTYADGQWDFSQKFRNSPDYSSASKKFHYMKQKSETLSNAGKTQRIRKPLPKKLINRIENYSVVHKEYSPSFEQRVKMRQRQSLSQLRANSFDSTKTKEKTKSSRKSEIKVKTIHKKNSKSVMQNPMIKNRLQQQLEGSTHPAPGEYEIKGQFENIVEKAHQNKLKAREAKAMSLLDKPRVDPLSLLLDKEMNKGSPGPGQYEISSTFKAPKMQKSQESKVSKVVLNKSKINNNANKITDESSGDYTDSEEDGSESEERYPLTYQFRHMKPAPPFKSSDKRFKMNQSVEEQPGPGTYHDTIRGMDAKTWKVLNSENLRNNVDVVVSHKKLLEAGFVKVGFNKKQKLEKPIYNNSEASRFTNKQIRERVGPGKYGDLSHNWIKKSYNYKFS